MKDILYELDFEQVMASTQLTADKTDMNVIDLASFGILGKIIHAITILVLVDAKATADGSNYFTLDLYHADAKTSATALTSGVKVTSTTGLLNSASPVINDTTLTAQSDKVIAIGYRGVKRFLQLQCDETGTADITVSVLAVGGVLDSQHGAKLA